MTDELDDDAWLEKRRAVLAFRRQSPNTTIGKQQAQHGVATYNRGCRCELCRHARRLYMQRYRAAKRAIA